MHSGLARSLRHREKETPQADAAKLQFEEGLACESQGNNDKALKAYAAAVRIAPDFAQAYFNMGNLLLDTDRVAEALSAYETAANLKPDSSGAWYNIALAHLRLGSLELAVTHCRAAILIRPDFGDAHLTLGSALLDLKLFKEALVSLDQAIALIPDNPNGYQMKGVTLQELGRHREALACYLSSKSLDPTSVECLGNLAGAYKELGELEQSLIHYRMALNLSPESADLQHNYGLALALNKQEDTAILAFRQAIRLHHRHAGALRSLGSLLAARGEYEEAFQLQRKAVDIEPLNFSGHLNLGITLLTTGNIKSATESFSRALQIEPDSPEANLCLGSAYKDSGDFDTAVQYINRSIELKPDYMLAHSVLLFVKNYTEVFSTPETLQLAKRFDQVVARQARPFTTWENQRGPEKCLRIGFISGDLYDHPVGYFFESISSEIAASYSSSTEIFVYATRDIRDPTSDRIKASCSIWRYVGNTSDSELAETIRQDSIDILIDLAGHSAHNRLTVFPWRAAPVQATWLGYFATTGLSCIDYLIADKWTLPSEFEHSFTEKIWRIPDTRLCFTAPKVNIYVSELPAIKNGYVTFGSFNNLSKIGESVLEVWATLLLKVPESRLLLKTKQLDDVAIRTKTVSRFAKYGIPESRLMFEGHQERGEFFSAHHKIDIALDSFPYPGGTTTVESLWMGVPVVTLSGKHFLGRQGVGLLMNAGLPNWIAKDHEEYVSMAILHSSNLESLAILRSRLRTQVMSSPLFSAPSFAMHLEECLRSMWKRWVYQ